MVNITQENGKQYTTCPACKTQREISKNTAWRIRTGRSDGTCRTCAVRAARKAGRKYTGVKTLENGSMVYWDTRKKVARGVYHIEVQCGGCHQKRWINISAALVSHFTGLCFSCIPEYKKRAGRQKPGYGITADHDYVLFNLVILSKEDHKLARPMSRVKNGDIRYIPEHRLVIARKLGRPLTKDEIVHHLDGDKRNNKSSNLILTTQRNHSRLAFEEYSAEVIRLRALLDTHGISY